MIKFGKDKVLLLHQLVIEKAEGATGICDFGLLESALESAFQTFDRKELFLSKQKKAVKIGYALVSNYTFADGNKRIVDASCRSM